MGRLNTPTLRYSSTPLFALSPHLRGNSFKFFRAVPEHQQALPDQTRHALRVAAPRAQIIRRRDDRHGLVAQPALAAG